MTTWTGDELSIIGGADEIKRLPLRPDGMVCECVTIWGVRHGDDLYMRSWRGQN